MSPFRKDWKAIGPNREQSRGSRQGERGRGGENRKGPEGASAYGIPKKRTSPLRARPATGPERVSTVILMKQAFLKRRRGRP
jgi:hypothetical protein